MVTTLNSIEITSKEIKDTIKTELNNPNDGNWPLLLEMLDKFLKKYNEDLKIEYQSSIINKINIIKRLFEDFNLHINTETNNIILFFTTIQMYKNKQDRQKYKKHKKIIRNDDPS